MLTSADYRKRAYSALNGKWGTAALTYFLVMIIMGVCGGLSVIVVGAILGIVLAGPLQYGLYTQSLKIMRGGMPSVNDLMAAQNRFIDTFLAYIINGLLILAWSLLLIIPGIIKAYSYSMTYFVMSDHPNWDAVAARQESEKLMDGSKMKLFCLHCTFLGWFLLSILTFGILFIWVIPYMNCAVAEFYDCLLPPRATVEHTDDASSSFDIPDGNVGDDPQSVDPFDHSDMGGKNVGEEPFYVFEEEIPRDGPDDPDDKISV